MDVPDWLTLLSAILTPVVAVTGVWVAVGQMRTNGLRLRYQLFEHRYSVYRAALDFLSIVAVGKPTDDAQRAYQTGIQGASFLVGKEIQTHLDDIWKRAIGMETDIELKGGATVLDSDRSAARDRFFRRSCGLLRRWGSCTVSLRSTLICVGAVAPRMITG